MSLDLVIKTGDSAGQIEKIRDNLGKLRSQLDSFSGNSALETTLQRIASFSGLPANSVRSIQELATALGKLSNIQSLSNVATGLNNLSRIDVAGVASSVSKLSTALSQLKAPNLSGVAQQLAAIGTSASTASGQIGVLASNLNKIKAPNIGNLAGQVQSVGDAAKSASSGIYGLGNGLSTVTGVLAGFGVALGGVGLAMFIKDTWEAQRSMTAFKIQMEGLHGSGRVAAEELKYVQQTALNTGQSLGVASEGYLRMSRAVKAAGGETSQAKVLFEGLSSALIVQGASAAESERAFRAFGQMLNKGKITAEEFTQQLGEILPAMALLSDALGKTPAEVYKLMEAGQLGVDAILKLGEKLQEVYGPQLAKALDTPQGALLQLKTSFELVQQSFGTGFAEGLKSGMQELTAAFVKSKTVVTDTGETVRIFSAELTTFGQSIASIGTFIGTTFGGIGSAIGLVAQNWDALGPAITSVTAAVGTLMALNLGAWFGSLAVSAGTFLLAITPVTGTIALLTAGIVYAVNAWGSWNEVLKTAGNVMLGVMYYTGFLTESMYTSAKAWLANATEVKKTTDETEKAKTSFSGVSSSTNAASAGLTSAGNAARGAAGGMREAAAESSQLDAAIGRMGGNTRTFDGLLAELNGTFTRTNGHFDDVTTSGNTLESLMGDLNTSTGQYGGALGTVNGAMSTGSKSAEVLAGAYGKTGSSASTSAGSVEVIAGAYDETGKAANRSVSPIETIAGRYGAAGTAAEGAATRVSGVTTQIGRSATEANNAITPVRNLAAAYRELATSKRGAGEGGGDGGGSGEVTAEGFSGGGISHLGGTMRQTVPISAFRGAPSFATGTSSTNTLSASVAGGGIPAILHSNEAVVPLTGGGSIPVEMSGGTTSMRSGVSSSALGGGDSAAMLLEMLNLAQLDFTLQTEIKTEIYRVWESLDLYMTMSREHWNKVDSDHLQMINHLNVIRTAILLENSRSAAMLEAINKLPTGLSEIKSAVESAASSIVSAVGNISISSSSSDSSSSSSGDLTSSTSASATPSSSATTSSSTSTAIKSSTNASADIYGGGKYSQVFGYGGRKNDYGLNSETGRWERISVGAADGSPNLWRDAQRLPQYADGTPTTGLDGKGGFVAMLHPNEAVIPLPDGRSVPVTFPEGTPGTDGGTTQNITVEITINAKDVDSFRASESQLIQELEAKLARATEKVGRMQSTDDPTKRV